MDWIDVGPDVHGLYKELLSVGSSVMRVEDHLTMQIPGARRTREGPAETFGNGRKG